MGYVEGTNRDQTMMMTYDDLVENESIVRLIDRFVEISNLEKMGFGRTIPSETGRPSYDPAAMTKLYLYGYENGIRSSRKLERETHRNVEMMWLMNGLRPDHKTIAEFRRQNIRPIQKLFHEFVRLCKSWDLIGGELIAVDGTKIKAGNNKKMNFSRKKLDARLEHIDEQIKEYLSGIEENDRNGERPYRTVTRSQYSNIYEETDRRTQDKRKSFGDCFFAVFTAAVPRLFLYLGLYFAAAPCFICQCNL